MNTTINKHWLRSVLSAFIALGFFIPFYSYAATCDFTRDLELGVLGEDVRCLQKYLNGNDFIISPTGAGAPGKETGEYKTLTKAAVIKWQEANNISPASGYFGPRSRAVYKSLASGGTIPSTTATPTTPASSNALIDEMLAKINALQNQAKEQTNTTAEDEGDEIDDEVADIHELMTEVLDAIEEAENEKEESDDDDAIELADENLEDAKSEFFVGVRSYLKGDYDKAKSRLNNALNFAEEAIDEIGGSSVKNEAEDLIDEVDDRLDEVEDAIDLADEDGEPTSDAEDLFDEAEDTLDEAEVAMDESDYEEALELAEEADELLDEAEDAIGESGSDVEDMLDEARDELDDAFADVDEAIDDGEDVGEAEDLLDEAEDLLDEAEDVLDDGDEDEAEDLIDDALDLIDDALGEW